MDGDEFISTEQLGTFQFDHKHPIDFDFLK